MLESISAYALIPPSRLYKALNPNSKDSIFCIAAFERPPDLQ